MIFRVFVVLLFGFVIGLLGCGSFAFCLLFWVLGGYLGLIDLLFGFGFVWVWVWV